MGPDEGAFYHTEGETGTNSRSSSIVGGRRAKKKEKKLGSEKQTTTWNGEREDWADGGGRKFGLADRR